MFAEANKSRAERATRARGDEELILEIEKRLEEAIRRILKDFVNSEVPAGREWRQRTVASQ